MNHRFFARKLSIPSLALIMVLTVNAFAKPLPVLDKVLQAAQQTRSFPTAQYIPDRDFDTRHVALDLRFDWEHEQVIGVETATFRPLVPGLRKIELDAADMSITSAKMGGNALKFDIDVPRQKLWIDLDRAYQPAEEVTLVIEYHTNGSQAGIAGLVGAGLRFIKPTPEDPTKPKQIWSQGESEYNHYWFPCYDHPNDFFTTEITATVEKPLTVIANGKLLETRENKDGTRTFHWKIDQPHASYLTSIIVGEYVPIVSEYQGIPIVTNVYPNEVKEGKVTTARLTEMVKFFSEKTGLKYPYAKYAQTTARDFGGGMENISATTQTDNMIHDARTELDSNTDGLQSHELAHQWFGDYVTCRDWSDIWLNESFATYFQAMWDEHKLGGDDFLYSDVKANQDAYLTAWKQGNRRPIVTKNYAHPDSVFDTYAYPRGGAVLHMLRQTLGEENWWKAINYYLNKYANQPVETEQFRIAIEESTGQAMDWFFDEWLYKMGHPIFRVTKTYDPATRVLKLSVEQLQTIDNTSQFPQVMLFQTPVNVEIGTASGVRVERLQILPKKEQSFSLSVDSKPLLVNFDYHGTLIKELEFDKTTDELAYQMKSDEDVLGRIWALSELQARVAAPTTSESEKGQITLELANAVSRDKFWAVRVNAATALADLKTPAARTALIAAASDIDARVRARAVTSLAVSKDASLAGTYVKLLGDQSYAVIRAAALALGETKSSEAYVPLETLASVPSWRDNIRASALTGLGELRDRRSMNLALRLAAVGNENQVRAAALRLLGRVGGDEPKAFDLIAEIARKTFKSSDYNLATAAGEALVSLGDSKGLVLLEEISHNAAISGRLRTRLDEYQAALRKSVAGTPGQGTQHP
ncbi:MAG TPA: M1 family aminopeptidase [Pyrinomonadaceae bacterium]|jgi:aminopeptidase N|nr:M1 family aminopeptidase [Pyrinomonadaceae bacterium]